MRSAVKIPPPATVDEYIKRAPAALRTPLQQIRKTIRAAAPEAEEVISYHIPGYKLHGMLAFFAVWKDHISFYPAPWGATALKKEMSAYEGSKGTIKFPISKPIPLALVTKMVKYRVKLNMEKANAKKLVEKKPVTKKTVKPVTAPARSKKPADAEQVEAYMKKLNHPMKAETEAVRTIIKNTDKKLSERIKWSAPSYHYDGNDIVTFGPYKDGKVLLVFHHPAIEKIKSALLEGNFKGRRLVYLDSMQAVKKNKKEIERIMKENIRLINK